jgi:hypothetical protein
LSKTIEMQINKSKKLQYELVYNSLLQIAKTVICCGKLGLPFRGHDDNKILKNIDEVIN